MLDPSVPEGCTPRKRPRLEQGRSVRSPSHEKEGAAEKVCDQNPHSLSLCAAVVEEVENSGVKLSLGRREGLGGK